VRVAYVDSSIVARYYLSGDVGHPAAAELFDDAETALVSATVTRIEVSGALVTAARSQNHDPGPVLSRLDADIAEGSLTLVAGDQGEVEAGALEIVRGHGVRALDAIHLATARLVLPELLGPGDVAVFLSADRRQSEAAAALGLAVA
jgi:uncharacterized protein